MNDYQDKAKECKCCGKHVPLPTVLKEYFNNTVCPTTFANIVEYKRIWTALGKRPQGSIRKHFSDYVQQMVEQTIDKKEDGSI